MNRYTYLLLLSAALTLISCDAQEKEAENISEKIDSNIHQLEQTVDETEKTIHQTKQTADKAKKMIHDASKELENITHPNEEN